MLYLKAKMLHVSYNNECVRNAETGMISHETSMRIITGPENTQHTLVCCELHSFVLCNYPLLQDNIKNGNNS